MKRPQPVAGTPAPPPDTPFGMSAPAPPGYRWELQTDPAWRLARDYERTRRCRRPGCTNTQAAALKRAHGATFHWWGYCADHLYGRVIVDGAVMVRRPVPLTEPPSQAALAILREIAARSDDEPSAFSPAAAREILRLIETRKETP